MKKFFKKLLKIIFFSKKEFYFPPKNNIVILDQIGAEKIKISLLKELDFTVLDLREEKINIPILILSLFNFFRYGKYSYRITFIQYTKAKIAITFIDTSLHFCFFMKKIKNCKLILIQNGRRQGLEIKPYLKKISQFKLECDYYFVFNKNYAELMQNYLQTNFVIGGSILNNLFLPNKKFLKVKKIQYISEFHPKEACPNDINYFNWEIQPTKFILEIIQEFCLEKKLELEIIGRIGDEKKEVEFYKNLNIKFKYVKKNFENYSKISEDSIITGMSSTFLGECFSRFFRVAFFDIRNDFFLYNENRPGFAYPKSTDDHGYFWSNKPVKKKILENLNFLYDVEENKWRSLVEEWSKEVVVHDFDNLIYKKILKKEGIIKLN